MVRAAPRAREREPLYSQRTRFCTHKGLGLTAHAPSPPIHAVVMSKSSKSSKSSGSSAKAKGDKTTLYKGMGIKLSDIVVGDTLGAQHAVPPSRNSQAATARRRRRAHRSHLTVRTYLLRRHRNLLARENSAP